MCMSSQRVKNRWGRRTKAAVTAGVLVAGLSVATIATASAAPEQRGTTITSTGLKAGAIKHVWLIMLENKSYDATFTGLNQNSYLWKTLPSQGVLLKNYFGTGHYSMDNYLALASGQAPEQDTQSDCSVENFDLGTNSNIVTTGKNKGQVSAPANSSQLSGANAPNGTNGCTYPQDTPTLFNQLDASGQTWKGYAQDLKDQQGREDAKCGAPGLATNDPSTNPTNMAGPFASGVLTYTGAQPNDQYVAKHFPFAWFHSLSGTKTVTGVTTPPLTSPTGGGTDCDANHIANLDDPSTGLYKDLQKESTTPAFNWITPDNCNDAHDALCKGNNMSGSFTSAGQPIYQTPTPDPQSTTPKNYTGGLYASDLFLEYYIPMIEKSAAFKDGGLIDITFDEADPPFTYSGNSFNNANAYGPTLKDQPNAANSLKVDAAGENINGKNVYYEPTGPNSTLGYRHERQPALPRAGRQRLPGPSTGVHAGHADTDPGQLRAEHRPGRREQHPGRYTGSSGRQRLDDVHRGPLHRGLRCRPWCGRHRRHDGPGWYQSDPGRHIRRTGQRHRPAVPDGADRRFSDQRLFPTGRWVRQPGRADRPGQQPHAQCRGGTRLPGARARPLTRCTTPPTRRRVGVTPAAC